jgi:CheY-like chemotaxis protein
MTSERTRVLLVDDEPSVTRLLKLNLEQSGRYDVRVENRGAQAVEAARAFQPAVILLDVVMPDLGGVDVAHALQSDPQLREVGIIFLTAVISTDQASAYGQLIQAYPVLSKPVSIDEVTRCIDDVAHAAAKRLDITGIHPHEGA